MKSKRNKENIRIGTLVNGSIKDPANYIRQILPHGFESFQLTFWQTLGNVDLKRLAAEVKEALGDSGAVISSIGIFGNPLEKEPLDKQTVDGWKKCIDAAHLFGCDVVAGFAGRLRNRPVHASMSAFRKVFGPLAQRASDRGVRLAFENCNMGGTWTSGDWNIAHNPVAWEMMFHEVPASNLGLCWEPCHQMVCLIDPMPQLRNWVKKIFHVHGKDATIHWDVVRKYGVFSSVHADPAYKSPVQFAPQFAYHRTPGFGDSNWADIITELRRGGFRGSIDIEGWHDPVYRGELEMTGQVHALNYLKRSRGGSFVENPV